VTLLNTMTTPLLVTAQPGNDTVYKSETFPGLVSGRGPLPEDFAIRGLLWTEVYHPSKWIEEAKVADEDRYFEVASMAEHRKERILWLGCRIAEHRKWIEYDAQERLFSVVAKFAEDLETTPRAGANIRQILAVDSMHLIALQSQSLV
jgi:hypothetical protein